MPKSGPLVPPVCMNALATTPNDGAGPSAEPDARSCATRSIGDIEVRAEVAVAALPIEIVEQLAMLGEDTGEALDPGTHRGAVEALAHARYQVSAGVRTGASQSSTSSSSRLTSVSEQPDMSSDVTYGPTSEPARPRPRADRAGARPRRT